MEGRVERPLGAQLVHRGVPEHAPKVSSVLAEGF